MSAPAARRVPGEPGIWIVVLGDIAAFLVLFGTFLVYRADQPAVFAASQAELSPAFGFVNTLLLLTSSLAVVAGVHAHRAADGPSARRAFHVAIALGGLFVVSKAIEWTSKADAGYVPDRDAFFSLYYVLTGLHLLHVVVGLTVLWLLARIAGRGDRRAQDPQLVESGAIFWHMVDLLWVVLFALVYFVH